MDPTALHLEIRNALSISDELGRYEHAFGNDDVAGHLAALRTSLDELERLAGRTHDAAGSPSGDQIDGLERSVSYLRARRDEIPMIVRPRFTALLSHADRVIFAHQHPWARVPSRPLLGMLPLARVVPQDVHSVADYLYAGAYLVSAKLARTTRARAVGIALGGGVAGTSLVTDYRLSAVKALPIEMHEIADHASGLTAMAMPFVLGYVKKDPIASAIQIMTGLMTCVASLFTDYRASKGRTWPRRSKGGPSVEQVTAAKRVPDAQRPLEGFSSAPSDWRPDEVWFAAR